VAIFGEASGVQGVMTTELSAWSERQRLGFVERLLFWRGFINRKDLCEHFSISMPQATNDLVTYTTLNPGACAYNVRSKRYEALQNMETKLNLPDFGEDMRFLGGSASPPDVPDFVVWSEKPLRTCDPKILRQLCAAVHSKKALQIYYYSGNSGTAKWRAISPRTFASDGLRWHVRAYCHENLRFQDFNIGRISKLREATLEDYMDEPDEDWHAEVKLWIRPAGNLDKNRRKALEMDYGMEDGALGLVVRKALQIYTCRRLGFVRWDQALPILNEIKELELFRVEELGG